MHVVKSSSSNSWEISRSAFRTSRNLPMVRRMCENGVLVIRGKFLEARFVVLEMSL